jgi:hypothetical protein
LALPPFVRAHARSVVIGVYNDTPWAPGVDAQLPVAANLTGPGGWTLLFFETLDPASKALLPEPWQVNVPQMCGADPGPPNAVGECMCLLELASVRMNDMYVRGCSACLWLFPDSWCLHDRQVAALQQAYALGLKPIVRLGQWRRDYRDHSDDAAHMVYKVRACCGHRPPV